MNWKEYEKKLKNNILQIFHDFQKSCHKKSCKKDESEWSRMNWKVYKLSYNFFLGWKLLTKQNSRFLICLVAVFNQDTAFLTGLNLQLKMRFAN